MRKGRGEGQCIEHFGKIRLNYEYGNVLRRRGEGGRRVLCEVITEITKGE